MIRSKAIALAGGLAACLAVLPGFGSTIFGSLSNFDVFNDTGGVCNGFEIELDGISSTDVVYEFGAPYERYGNPTLVDFPGGVYVRYESQWDPVNKVFTATTPIPPVISPTAGHQCWTGGSAGYLTSGCEHFGISLVRNPTNVVYRWLVADPANPGKLVRFGTSVPLPVPTWVYVPPPPPVVNQPPPPPAQVRVLVPAPPPPPQFQFGDAQWVKIYKIESPRPAELNHLVTDDPSVPQDPAEIETEWVLLQAGSTENELDNGGAPNSNSESVTRRYEFYQYSGLYDPENHEAIRGCPTDAPCPGELGNYIGAQMVAANLVPADQVVAVQVTTGALAYSRVTKSWNGTITIKNTGPDPVKGPVSLSFANLGGGITVMNPTGTFQGFPYITLPTINNPNESLAPNQSVTIPVHFGGQYAVTFSPIVYTGSLQ